MDEENKTSNLKTLHTYTSDMTDAIRTNEASVIKIALLEKQKRDQDAEYRKASGTGVSKLLLVLGGVILVGIAVLAFYFVFKQKVSNAPIPQDQVAVKAAGIISSDATTTVDLTSAQNQIDVVTAIKKETASLGNPGSIKQIILTQTIAGLSQPIPILDLFSLMKINAPSALLRNLNDQYMIGAYTPAKLGGSDITPKAHLFFILNVKDYNLAYKTGLDWEKTLLSNMFTFFNIDVSGDRNTLLDKEWKDITINNMDARILYDSYGNDVLYYIFPNKEYLIITDSKDAIKEINARLFTKTTKPL